MSIVFIYHTAHYNYGYNSLDKILFLLPYFNYIITMICYLKDKYLTLTSSLKVVIFLLQNLNTVTLIMR